jgi:hypothetical protein
MEKTFPPVGKSRRMPAESAVPIAGGCADSSTPNSAAKPQQNAVSDRGRLALLDTDQFDIEQEQRIGRHKSRNSALAKSQMRRNADLTLAADAHPFDAVFQTRNHIAAAQLKGDFVIFAEDVAATQSGCVNDPDATAAHRLGPATGLVFDDLNASRHVRSGRVL